MDQVPDNDEDRQAQDAARRRVLRRAAEVLHAIGIRTPIIIRHLPPNREPTSRPEEMLRVARTCEALAKERDARRFSEGILALAQVHRSVISSELSLPYADTSPDEDAALRALQSLLVSRELTGE